MGYRSAQKVIRGYENKYDQIRKEGDTDLGYRDMNSRLLNMEKQSVTADEWRYREARHKTRKLMIEREWHRKNDVTLYVQIAGQTGRRDTDARYYAPFDLKVLETFLKNSSRGKKENSGEYNNVVTDLEIYNLMSKDIAAKEKVTLLENLQNSCRTYISEKNPFGREGRKRKAMITQVAEQVELLLADARTAALAVQDNEQDLIEDEEEQFRNFAEEEQFNNQRKEEQEQLINHPEENILQEAEGSEEQEKTDAESIRELIEQAYSSYQELEEDYPEYLEAPSNKNKLVQSERSIEIINNACKIHYRLISMDLNGKIELSEEERKDLDMHMKHIFMALNHSGGVGDCQSDIMSSRFFNAIGWSEHKPRICKNIDAEIKRFPNRVKMFHTIANNSNVNMTEIVSQVRGEKHQYYSFGCYGLGLYTAAREQGDAENIELEDLKASEHSWMYGDTVGSVQFTFTLNEHAKIIEKNEVPQVLETIKKKYPEACDRWNFRNDVARKYGTHLPAGAALLLAFLGYNTIQVKRADNSAAALLDYYCTTDRKALSASAKLERQGNDFKREEKTVMDYTSNF